MLALGRSCQVTHLLPEKDTMYREVQKEQAQTLVPRGPVLCVLILRLPAHCVLRIPLPEASNKCSAAAEMRMTLEINTLCVTYH